jgi:hypothetical protein
MHQGSMLIGGEMCFASSAGLLCLCWAMASEGA